MISNTQFSAQLNINNSNANFGEQVQSLYTTSGSGVDVFNQYIFTSSFTKISSSLDNIQTAMFVNVDKISTVQISTTNDSSGVFTYLTPSSSVALVSWSGSATFYAKAETSASYIHYYGSPA